MNHSWKQRHSLVLCTTTGKHVDFDVLANWVLNQVGKDTGTVVGGVGAVIVNRSVVTGKMDESQILNSTSFIIGMREDDNLRNIRTWQQWNLVVRLGQG